MERPDALAVWLHLVEQTRREAGLAMVDELAKAGITASLGDASAAPRNALGVVLFEAWSEGLAELLSALSARATLLAVCCGPALSADAMWAALAAGASDLLQWPAGGAAAD
ncbi:hypothetical protein GTP77_26200, partial [Massilia sp. FT127W]|nr:hypothetical protein [Pseudoduganella aquatica]